MVSGDGDQRLHGLYKQKARHDFCKRNVALRAAPQFSPLPTTTASKTRLLAVASVIPIRGSSKGVISSRPKGSLRNRRPRRDNMRPPTEAALGGFENPRINVMTFQAPERPIFQTFIGGCHVHYFHLC